MYVAAVGGVNETFQHEKARCVHGEVIMSESTIKAASKCPVIPETKIASQILSVQGTATT